MSDEALNRLADAAGLEPRYWDIGGRLHERSPATARHLLGALGIAANTEAEIAASLTMLEEEPWREGLPAAVIVTEGRDIEMPLRLASDAPVHMLRWSVILENGDVRNGESRLDDLAVNAMGAAAGVPVALRHIRLPSVPSGYHRFRLEGAGDFETSLIVAPATCHLPDGYECEKYWGVTAQLYTVKSQTNWGIGDFGDLGALTDWAAAHGADTVALNPLHALFLDAPDDASPYSPNSRLFLNPLYLDVTAIPDFAESADARSLAELPPVSEAIRRARASSDVEYPAVAAAKRAVLERLYRHFAANHIGQATGRGAAFQSFVRDGGTELARFATFQMLSELRGTHDWPRWPRGQRTPESAEVRRLTREHASRISFFQYLQWQCDAQLCGGAARARAGGMRIGLYRDLAVSVDASSADAWANATLFMGGARAGAPPDPFNEMGQEWGIVPPNPRRLRDTGYAHVIALLRANMRHAGALRIDHVMGWQRLFVVPAGAAPGDGAYLRFPLDDLLAIAALESRRNRCVVVGEDLGTVPEGFRERMAGANVLSCRVLYFEQDHGRFRRPGEFPVTAAASVTTHDLPTLRGYWMAEDIGAKARLGIFKSTHEEQEARTARERDKAQLLQALRDEGLWPHETGDWLPGLTDAIHAYLARSRCLLCTVQLDDLTGETQQVNLPGTMAGHNWRRRLHLALEALVRDPAIENGMRAVARERGRTVA